jgi:hypothetical protein
LFFFAIIKLFIVLHSIVVNPNGIKNGIESFIDFVIFGGSIIINNNDKILVNYNFNQILGENWMNGRS